MKRMHETYYEENTLVEMVYEHKTGSTLIRLRDMSGEITRKEMNKMVNKIFKGFSKKQLMELEHCDFWKILKEAIIVQCVTDWINNK